MSLKDFFSLFEYWQEDLINNSRENLRIARYLAWWIDKGKYTFGEFCKHYAFTWEESELLSEINEIANYSPEDWDKLERGA